jgi:N-acetylglutamate synthase-like GNAT family acetyltransferase
MTPQGPEIRRTGDVAAVMRLGTAAGLAEMEDDLEGIEAMWGAYEDGDLIAAVVLRHHAGLDLVGWLAVAAGRRGRGIGSRLLEELEREALARGVRCLWAMARAPGFFIRHGYEPSDTGPDHDALFGNCPTCDQYGTTCSPRAVRKTLAADEQCEAGGTVGDGCGCGGGDGGR